MNDVAVFLKNNKKLLTGDQIDGIKTLNKIVYNFHIFENQHHGRIPDKGYMNTVIFKGGNESNEVTLKILF